MKTTKLPPLRIRLNKVRGFEWISPEQCDKDFNRPYSIKKPKRATKYSAGYDFFAPYDINLKPGESKVVPTGIRAYMQEGEVLNIYPRSGLGFKYHISLANTVGIIDDDYYYSDNEGHIFIKIHNGGDKPVTIKQDEAFAQGVFQKFLLTDGDNFEDGAVRNGGFGSTSK